MYITDPLVSGAHFTVTTGNTKIICKIKAKASKYGILIKQLKPSQGCANRKNRY